MTDSERARLWLNRDDPAYIAEPDDFKALDLNVASLAAEFQAVRLEERERCAAMCENNAFHAGVDGIVLAEAIRGTS